MGETLMLVIKAMGACILTAMAIMSITFMVIIVWAAVGAAKDKKRLKKNAAGDDTDESYCVTCRFYDEETGECTMEEKEIPKCISTRIF